MQLCRGGSRGRDGHLLGLPYLFHNGGRTCDLLTTIFLKMAQGFAVKAINREAIISDRLPEPTFRKTDPETTWERPTKINLNTDVGN